MGEAVTPCALAAGELPGPLRARLRAPGGRLFSLRPSAALRSAAIHPGHFLPSRFSDFSTWFLLHFITCIFCEAHQLHGRQRSLGRPVRCGAQARLPAESLSASGSAFTVRPPAWGGVGLACGGAVVVLQTPR